MLYVDNSSATKIATVECPDDSFAPIDDVSGARIDILGIWNQSQVPYAIWTGSQSNRSFAVVCFMVSFHKVLASYFMSIVA